MWQNCPMVSAAHSFIFQNANQGRRYNLVRLAWLVFFKDFPKASALFADCRPRWDEPVRTLPLILLEQHAGLALGVVPVEHLALWVLAAQLLAGLGGGHGSDDIHHLATPTPVPEKINRFLTLFWSYFHWLICKIWTNWYSFIHIFCMFFEHQPDAFFNASPCFKVRNIKVQINKGLLKVEFKQFTFWVHNTGTHKKQGKDHQRRHHGCWYFWLFPFDFFFAECRLFIPWLSCNMCQKRA